MKKNTPPTNRVAALPVAFTGRLGQPFTCDTCGETRPLSLSSAIATSKNESGHLPTCRSCVGRRGARAIRLPKGSPRLGKLDADEVELLLPDPTRDAKTFWAQLARHVARLYEIDGNVEHEPEQKLIIAELLKHVRMTGDPNAGSATDEEMAFRVMWEVCRPALAKSTALAPVHADIISALVDPAERVLLLASRGSGKSTLLQVAAAWWLLRSDTEVILVLSAGSTLARRFLGATRALIDRVPILRHLRPTDDGLDSASQFVIAPAQGRLGASTSFTAAGITSAITGLRATRVIFDDVEARGSTSPEIQEQLMDRCTEAEHIGVPGFKTYAIGTPQFPGSLYIKWNKAGGWSTHVARVFEQGEDGDITSRWPERFTDADLRARKRKLPARDWALHVALDLSGELEENRPLKLRDLITVDWPASKTTFPTIVRPGSERCVLDVGSPFDADDCFVKPGHVSPEDARYLMTLVAIDPASGVGSNDSLGFAVLSITSQGLGVLRYAAGIRGTSAQDVMTKAAILTHQFAPQKVVIEARADSLWPSTFASVLAKRGYPIIPDVVASGARKGDRLIDSLSPPMANRRLVVLQSVWLHEDGAELVKQLTFADRDGRTLRRDDIVDAFAWAVQTAAPFLVMDESDGIEVNSTATLDELKKLPLRRGGLDEETLAVLYGPSEDEERLRLRLDSLMATQADDIQRGRIDPRLAALIKNCREDLTKLRRYARPLPSF